ncbi:MAG: dTDP-4-dehydrorhamnose reductase [Bacteroidales bacterium]|nr:dTDP-4-dehydrorhamnose reductase [Bacteroidales bacterium]
MASTLITGANGQLGRSLREIAGKLPGTLHFTDIGELDICDKSALNEYVKTNHIDIIINCAAYTAVDKAEDEPEIAAMINSRAPGILAETARENGALLVHISTDYVFDGKGPRPYKESDRTSPTSVYGKTKLAGEKAIEESGCRYIIIRTAWLYSEYGNNFAKTIIRLAKERDVVSVVFDQTGTPTYAGDLADAIAEVVSHKDDPEFHKKGENRIYHFSNEGVCSWYDFALEIVERAGIKTATVKPVTSDQFPSKASRPAYSVLDKGQIKNIYGLTIPHWKIPLKKCIDSLNNNR